MIILERVDRGELLDLKVVELDILSLARSVPGIDAEKFTYHICKLVETRNVERARGLVSALEDSTSKPWVVPAGKLISFSVKLLMIFAVIYFAVLLAS